MILNRKWDILTLLVLELERSLTGSAATLLIVKVKVKVKGGEAVPRHIHNVEDVLRLAKLARRNDRVFFRYDMK